MSDDLEPYGAIIVETQDVDAPVRPCVLMVEDDLSARWLMRNALKGSCDFLSATTGEEALDLYQRHRPQVVVLDFGLPNKKGDDILKSLLGADPDAYVVVMSGEENLATMQAMVVAGARAMLVKPFRKEDLLHAVLGPRHNQGGSFFSR